MKHILLLIACSILWSPTSSCSSKTKTKPRNTTQQPTVAQLAHAVQQLKSQLTRAQKTIKRLENDLEQTTAQQIYANKLIEQLLKPKLNPHTQPFVPTTM